MLYILRRFKLAEELITSLFSQGLLRSIQLQWDTQERKRWIDLSTHTHTHTHTHTLSLSLSLSLKPQLLPCVWLQHKSEHRTCKAEEGTHKPEGMWLAYILSASQLLCAMAKECTKLDGVEALSTSLRSLQCSVTAVSTPATGRELQRRAHKGGRGEVCSRGRRRGEESVNTEKKESFCTRFDDPEATRSFGPLAVMPKWPWEKEWHLFLLSLRGFSTLGSIRPLEWCP
jgi:hypothetical protein